MRSSGARTGGGAFGGDPGVGRDRWRLIVPGWPQWRRGQRGRALVLLGSYLSALGVGLFAWGSAPGAALLAFAAFSHASSVADAIRQGAFPGFGPWAPWFSASVGLGAVGYAPALAVGLQVAFPAWTPGGGFLVNRSAYDEGGPEAGHWVWLDREGPGKAREVALVVAVGGQRVAWSDGEYRVDGRHSPALDGASPPDRRSRGTFEVPEGALLVVGNTPGLEDAPGPERSGPGFLAVVPADRAIGRPWARYYPLWSRRLLS